MGLKPERKQLLHRAALLHDLGKLRVPNSILDKAGKLDGAGVVGDARASGAYAGHS